MQINRVNLLEVLKKRDENLASTVIKKTKKKIVV